MMRPVHADDYLGRRFDMRRYNCWHLVRDVWRDMTGVDLGDLTPRSLATPALAQAAGEAAEGDAFLRVDSPPKAGIVLFERPRWMPHVGVMFRGKVLHMQPDGARYQTLDAAARGFRDVSFWLPRWREEVAP